MNNKELIINYLVNHNGRALIVDIAKCLNFPISLVCEECDKLIQRCEKVVLRGKNRLVLKNKNKDLDTSLINALIENEDIKVYEFNKLVSSNTFLKDNINMFKNNSVILAHKQSGGRGRHDRSFFCYDGGIYFSMLFKQENYPNIDFSCDLTFLTAASSLALIYAIKDVLNIDASIKWVNDIYLDNKKVAGILAEGLYKDNEQSLILGIGINVKKVKMPDELIDIATFLTSNDVNRSILLASIINNLTLMFKEFDKDKIRKEYSKHLFIKGKTVDVVNLATNEMLSAKVVDINDDLELIVSKENNLITLNNEEVRIKVK